MSNPNVGFRAHALLANQIKARTPKLETKLSGAIAKRDVERWYSLMARELETIHLSPAEVALLLKICDSAERHNEDFVMGLGYLSSVSEEPGFGHVRESLAHKLNFMAQTARWALVDACERYEVYRRQNPDSTFGMALHAVGLHSYDLTPEELASVEAAPAAAPADLEPLGETEES